MFDSNGLITAPCGVPLSVGCHPSKASITPLLSIVSMSASTRPSAIFCPTRSTSLPLRYRVEVGFQISVHHAAVAALEQLLDSAQRRFASSAGSEPIALRSKFTLEDRFDHMAQCALHDPISHRWNPQRPLFLAPGFLDPDPLDRPRTVVLLAQFPLQVPDFFAPRGSPCGRIGNRVPGLMKPFSTPITGRTAGVYTVRLSPLFVFSKSMASSPVKGQRESKGAVLP
jgi:hypothetical protein